MRAAVLVAHKQEPGGSVLRQFGQTLPCVKPLSTLQVRLTTGEFVASIRMCSPGEPSSPHNGRTCPLFVQATELPTLFSARRSGRRDKGKECSCHTLHYPGVILMDEPTSSVESESEEAVLAALKAVSQRRTTIVASHRPVFAENATEIVYLDNGRMVSNRE